MPAWSPSFVRWCLVHHSVPYSLFARHGPYQSYIGFRALTSQRVQDNAATALGVGHGEDGRRLERTSRSSVNPRCQPGAPDDHLVTRFRHNWMCQLKQAPSDWTGDCKPCVLFSCPRSCLPQDPGQAHRICRRRQSQLCC